MPDFKWRAVSLYNSVSRALYTHRYMCITFDRNNQSQDFKLVRLMFIGRISFWILSAGVCRNDRGRNFFFFLVFKSLKYDMRRYKTPYILLKPGKIYVYVICIRVLIILFIYTMIF